MPSAGLGAPLVSAPAAPAPLAERMRPRTFDEFVGLLASDDAAYVTGTTLVVDGGTRAHFPHGGSNPMNNKK